MAQKDFNDHSIQMLIHSVEHKDFKGDLRKIIRDDNSNVDALRDPDIRRIVESFVTPSDRVAVIRIVVELSNTGLERIKKPEFRERLDSFGNDTARFNVLFDATIGNRFEAVLRRGAPKDLPERPKKISPEAILAAKENSDQLIGR